LTYQASFLNILLYFYLADQPVIFSWRGVLYLVILQVRWDVRYTICLNSYVFITFLLFRQSITWF